MKRRTQQCIAAFAITAILVGAMCGFMAVDLSTDRYMPGQFDPLFHISRMDSTGLDVSLLGWNLSVDSVEMDQVKEGIWLWRGLLPRSISLTGAAAAKLYTVVEDYQQTESTDPSLW